MQRLNRKQLTGLQLESKTNYNGLMSPGAQFPKPTQEHNFTFLYLAKQPKLTFKLYKEIKFCSVR